jgi:TolB-like protein
MRSQRRHRASRGRKAALAASAVFAIAAIASGVWALTRTRTSEAGSLAGRFDRSRVAVLYFNDESRDGRLTPLADGLTEELIDELSAVKALDVVSKGGVGSLRSASVDSAARALKAGTLLRGSVEEVGGRIRVSVRLFDGNSGGTEFERTSFERPAGDVLTVRDTLAQQVAEFLRVRLGHEIRLRGERAGTENADAWLFVRQAERETVLAESLAAADSAAAAAAKFAAADSILAAAERLDAQWAVPTVARATLAQRQIRFQKNEQRLARLVDGGLAHADRAVALDPRNADALEVRGSLRFTKMVRGLAPDPSESAELLRGAEEDLRKAVGISPSQAGAWTALSRLYYRKYNKVEANLAARRAYEADAYLSAAPEILWRLYVTSYDLEQFVDATNWCDLAARRYPRDPMFVRCRLWLLTATDREPDVDEGWRLAAKFDSLAPPNAREMMRREAQLPIAAALGRRGLRDSADRVLVRARADRSLDPRGDLMSYEAAIRVMIGDTDEAIRLLQEFLTANPLHREGYVKNQTWWWRPLQNDPRFKELVGSGN